jgi:riboflavin synthase
MFTGIVEETGKVKTLTQTSLSVKASRVLENSVRGDSIAVNGVCLTVVDSDPVTFTVEIMPETLRLTNIGSLRSGDTVNLERAMPAQGRFGGHFVQGHIDATGKVKSITPEGSALIISITCDKDLLKYIVRKGFIAVNGVSLTVTDCTGTSFSISLVSYSRNNTNLGFLKTGQVVNLEVDIIAKYIEKYYQPNKQEGIISLLDQYDYLKAR